MATRKEHVLVMADLGRWLDRRHLPVGALDEARIAQFLVCRRRRGRVARSHATTLGVVLEMLRSTGAARPAPREAEKDVVPVDRATRAFAQYLSQERGLSCRHRPPRVPLPSGSPGPRAPLVTGGSRREFAYGVVGGVGP
jgi:hypothetical protein